MIRLTVASTALIAGLITCSGAAAASAASHSQSSAQVSAADAAPFMGDWTLNLQGPNGPGTFDLSVKLEKEKVVGEIATGAMATQQISDVSRAEKTLVLRYSFTWEGNPVEAVVSLTPVDDGKVDAKIDFASGAYTMTGTAAKKEKKQ
ncbi:MAG TPA: hypothetical protein VH740_04750 [Vicinamibacterales bacterium]|jgi:hypothetical protein